MTSGPNRFTTTPLPFRQVSLLLTFFIFIFDLLVSELVFPEFRFFPIYSEFFILMEHLFRSSVKDSPEGTSTIDQSSGVPTTSSAPDSQDLSEDEASVEATERPPRASSAQEPPEEPETWISIKQKRKEKYQPPSEILVASLLEEDPLLFGTATGRPGPFVLEEQDVLDGIGGRVSTPTVKV